MATCKDAPKPSSVPWPLAASCLSRHLHIHVRQMNRRVLGLYIVAAGSILNVACAEIVVPESTMASLTGVLIEGGVECQLFQTSDGAQYTLMGDFTGFQNGDKVQVLGEEVEVSFCMQGKTLLIKAINKVK